MVVVDSPIGGVGPEVTPPPTDTVPGDVSRPVDIVPAASLFLIVAAVVLAAAKTPAIRGRSNAPLTASAPRDIVRWRWRRT